MTNQSAIGEPFRAEFEVFGPADGSCFRVSPSGLNDGVPDLTGASVSVRRSGSKTYAVVTRSMPVSDPILRVTLEETCSARLSKTYTLLLPMTAARTTSPQTAAAAPAPARSPNAPPRQPARALIARSDLGTSFTLSRSASLNQLARTLYPSDRALRRAFISATRKLNAGDRSVRSSRRAIGAGSTLLLPDPESIDRALDALREAAANERAKRAAAAEQSAAPVKATEAPRDIPTPDSSASALGETPSEAPQPDRLVIMGATPEVSGFKMSTRLGDPTAVDRTSDAERDALRREQALIMALDSQIIARLELSERIERLEALQDVLRAEMAATDPGTVPDSSADADNPPASVTSDMAPEAQAPAVARAPAPREPAPAAAPPQPAPAPAVTPPPPQEDTPWWPYIAGAALALLLLLWWQRRRAQEDFVEYESLSEAEPIEPAVKGTSATVEETIAPEEASRQGQDSFDFSVVEWDAPPPADLDHTIAPVVIEEEEMVEEHESAVELADIMMSFGRVQGAAETLAEFIRGNPKKAVQPWIKLLEVYKTANMRGEFDALSDKLNKTFNVKAVTWESFDRVKRASESVEQLPHIMQILQSQWMTQECQIYVQKLLRDNRGGTREGFPLGIVDDLLTVQTILEDQLGPYRLSDEEIQAMIAASEAAQSAFGAPEDHPTDSEAAEIAADQASVVDFDEFNATDVEPTNPEDTAFQDIFDSQSSTTLDLPDLDFQLEENADTPAREKPAHEEDDSDNIIEFERTQIFRKDADRD